MVHNLSRKQLASLCSYVSLFLSFFFIVSLFAFAVLNVVMLVYWPTFCCLECISAATNWIQSLLLFFFVVFFLFKMFYSVTDACCNIIFVTVFSTMHICYLSLLCLQLLLFFCISFIICELWQNIRKASLFLIDYIRNEKGENKINSRLAYVQFFVYILGFFRFKMESQLKVSYLKNWNK